jgi:hypothetical protein
MRQPRLAHKPLIEAVLLGVIAILVVGVGLAERLPGRASQALGAGATVPAASEVITLPSSESGELTLIRTDEPPAFSQQEAMQIVHDFGVDVALGGERFGKPVTVSATYGIGTLGRPGGPGLPWLGDRNVPLKGTGTILDHVENRPMWILDYDNAYAPAPACPGCDSLFFKHAVYAVDEQTRSVLIVWFYNQVPSNDVPTAAST